MGYYTRYSLTWKPKTKEVPYCPTCGKPVGTISIHDLIEEHIENTEGMRDAIDDCGNTYQETKWYEYRRDMVALSKKFPDVLFTLTGHGERNADIWCEYYRDGKYQRKEAVIILGDFDPDAFSEFDND